MQPDVRDWFARRTSSAPQWRAEDLVERKQGVTVSVVLPALNEARTVGQIVAMLHRELVERVPLIDELVVMDSSSVDATAVIASAAGAHVVPVADVLPEHPVVPGKGDALWKSLFVTSGDLIVFVDADLVDPGPQFVAALLGPLLTHPEVAFVKALYERPLMTDAGVAPAAGGRVTEVLARPLLNLHWPLLAGIVQPLSGEYAGRRSVLDAVPFASGYGVEIAMLIDLLDLVGLDGIAQVDVGRKTHRHQSDAALGRMASALYQTVLARLGPDAHRLFLSACTELTQFRAVEGRWQFDVADIVVTERPPARTVPAYATKQFVVRSSW